MYKFDKIVENVYNQQKSLETLTEAEGGLVGSYLNFVRNTVARRAKVLQKTLDQSNYTRGNVLYLKDVKTNFPILGQKLGVSNLRTNPSTQLAIRPNGSINNPKAFATLLYNTIDAANKQGRNYITLNELLEQNIQPVKQQAGQQVKSNVIAPDEQIFFNDMKEYLKNRADNAGSLFYYISQADATKQQEIDESPGRLQQAATGAVNVVGSEIGKALSNTSTTW